MKSIGSTFGLTVFVALWGSAWAADSVVVESRAIPAGEWAEIGIRVTNSDSLCGLVVPLEIRAVTPGSFITQLQMGYGGRLGNALTGAIVAVQHGVKDTTCSSGNSGYGNVVFDSVGSIHAVSASPEGAMFVRARWNGGDLSPGSDSAPSLRLIVRATSTNGTFEVDTTCMIPNNHLTFAVNWPNVQAVVPTFVKGVETIAPCNCPNQGDYDANGSIDVFDVIAAITEAFSGGPSPWDQTCTDTRGDANCDLGVDVFDVIYLVDLIFTGGPAPCNPCTALLASGNTPRGDGLEYAPLDRGTSPVVNPRNWH